jgi:DNA sulfur modification protein DndB
MATKIQLPAIRGIIGDWIYYQTVIPFAEVVRRIDNDHSIREYESLNDVLQRDLSGRSKKIAAYLLREKTRFFNSAIIGLFGGTPNWYSFNSAPSAIPEMSLSDEVLNTIGILELSGDEKLFSIDGQHRIEGIKQALSENPKAFPFDELPVIIVAHNDSSKGKVRTRRLFSEINTKALKVSGLDDLITNEDNPIDINTRRLFAEFEPFEKETFVQLSPNTRILSTADEFTTILNLRSVNKILYSSEYKFNDVRPSDNVIESLYSKTLEFWQSAVDNIPSYNEVLITKESVVSEYRNYDGGSLLFRPIGIDLLAEAYISWVAEFGSSSGFWTAFNSIDHDLNSIYWKDVLWDNAKKNMRTRISPKFLREYLRYLIGLAFDEDYTLSEYNKLKGVEKLDEENLEDLPTRPN